MHNDRNICSAVRTTDSEIMVWKNYIPFTDRYVRTPDTCRHSTETVPSISLLSN